MIFDRPSGTINLEYICISLIYYLFKQVLTKKGYKYFFVKVKKKERGMFREKNSIENRYIH